MVLLSFGIYLTVIARGIEAVVLAEVALTAKLTVTGCGGRLLL